MCLILFSLSLPLLVVFFEDLVTMVSLNQQYFHHYIHFEKKIEIRGQELQKYNGPNLFRNSFLPTLMPFIDFEEIRSSDSWSSKVSHASFGKLHSHLNLH